SRKLAAAAHYPAIDVLTSASRVMNRVVERPHAAAAAQLRKRLAKFREVELLVRVGEYQAGSDPEADIAIASIGQIRALLQQGADEFTPYAETVTRLQALSG